MCFRICLCSVTSYSFYPTTIMYVVYVYVQTMCVLGLECLCVCVCVCVCVCFNACIIVWLFHSMYVFNAQTCWKTPYGWRMLPSVEMKWMNASPHRWTWSGTLVGSHSLLKTQIAVANRDIPDPVADPRGGGGGGGGALQAPP